MKDLEIATTSGMRSRLKKRVDMYDNDWDDQLDEELKKQFHGKTYPKVKTMADASMNILRRIVREVCSVYREPAERKIKGASPEVQDAANQYFRSLYLDQTMQVAHRYAKAATSSFVLVRKASDDEIVLRVLTPESVYIETDSENPRVMRLFAYVSDVTDHAGIKRTIWTAYTDSEVWLCDGSGKVLERDPRTNEVYDHENAYGLIPAVCFPAEFQVRSFWNENWNKDAAAANIRIGALSTYMDYLIKVQSFKQIVLNSDRVSDELKDQILDPLFPLLLSGNATANTLDLNTQLEPINNVIRSKVAAIANNYGISAENFTLTTQAASGFSLKIANQSLQDIREADIPLCAHVEQELYRIICAVSGLLPEGAEIQFNPGEVTWPEEWTTLQARWEFEFKNGISSPVDYVMQEDPQLSRDDAILKIKERQAEIKMLKPNMSAWDMIIGAQERQGAGPAFQERATQTGALSSLTASVVQDGNSPAVVEVAENETEAEND